MCHTSVADVQLLLSTEYVVSLGRACKYINNPSLMPDLNLNVSSHTSNIQPKVKMSMIPTPKNYNPPNCIP